MITPDNVSLWIVNFQRQDALFRTLNGWLGTFPFKDVNVIMNDPTMPDPANVHYPKIKVWRNIFRESWETGSIAWCWNQAMRHTFLTHDWCLMSQDDVDVYHGWDQLITDQYDTYIAPVGDTVMLQSLPGFNRVGWFDERFRAIGGPEADYVLRSMRTIPERVSIHDEHVWQLRHNDVGLANYWKPHPREGEVAATRANYNVPLSGPECFGRWVEKWGVGVDEMMCSHAWHTKPIWPEIDWYPAFTRRLIERGRR